MSKGDIHIDFAKLLILFTHGSPLMFAFKWAIRLAVLYFLIQWGILTKDNYFFVKGEISQIITNTLTEIKTWQ